MNIKDRVVIDAAATGDGIYHHGEIIDIYEFGRSTFVDVKFDEPDYLGRTGITITNTRLITKEYQPVKCGYSECAHPFVVCENCPANKSKNKFALAPISNPHGTYQGARGLNPYINYSKKS